MDSDPKAPGFQLLFREDGSIPSLAFSHSVQNAHLQGRAVRCDNPVFPEDVVGNFATPLKGKSRIASLAVEDANHDLIHDPIASAIGTSAIDRK